VERCLIPYFVVGGTTQVAKLVRWKYVEKRARNGRNVGKFVRQRSQRLPVKKPLVCNDCGREFSKKRTGSCSTCGSTEFVYSLDGRAVFVDFSSNFTRYIPEASPAPVR
jgi:predicted Zn-ribbon and HTH transcriptional regulator